MTLTANTGYTVQLSIGHKTLSGGVGTDPSNVTKLMLYAGASGTTFGTLIKEWTYNAFNQIAAPVSPQTIRWALPEFNLETGATPPTGTLRLVLQNAGPGYSYFDLPQLLGYSNTALSTGASSGLPANPSFESPVLATDNTSSTPVTGWGQDTPNSGAEIRREDAGKADGANHLVIRNTNYRVWQDFVLTANPNSTRYVRVSAGRKAWNAGNSTGTAPSNLTRIRLYQNPNGTNFGTLLKEWTCNASTRVDAPQAGQSVAWANLDLPFTTGASQASALRLSLENAGPGHSYFDFPQIVSSNGLSGTSMAAPTMAAGLALLQEMQQTQGGAALWSSTRRGLLINTADDATAAPPILGLSTVFTGPDGIYGYGVGNIEKAADLTVRNLRSPSRRGHIRQFALFEGKTVEWPVQCDGTKPLRVVLAWNDPAWQDSFSTALSGAKGVPDLGAPTAPTADDPASRLVNDLDLEVVAPGGAISYPYKLNAANPTAAATTGNNNVDNAEQVIVAAPAAGTWTLRVRHEGNGGTLKQSVKLLPGQAGYGTPDADDPLTPENEATMPRYRLDSGGVQPFALIVDGNTPTSADALRFTSYSHSVANGHTLSWQSTKGVVYLVERSLDLQIWETRTAALTWVNLTGNPSPPALFYVTATGAQTTINVPPPTGTVPKLFYRIREGGLP